MEKTIHTLPITQTSIFDISFDQQGNWAATTLDEAGAQWLKLPGGKIDPDTINEQNRLAKISKRYLETESFCTLLPEKVAFPLIACLKDEFFVVNSRTDEKFENAFIYDRHGKLAHQFYVGDGVEDVVVVGDKIVITYFDEGVFGDFPLAYNGVNIFDRNGKHLYGYHDQTKSKRQIYDCYAAVGIDSTAIAFHAYDDSVGGFSTVILNVDTYEETAFEPPKELDGCGAISIKDRIVYLFSPYKDNKGIYSFNLDSKQHERIGECEERQLKGLPGGRFVGVEDKNYAMISL